MGQEIAINVSREETRVAVLDNGVMTDLYIDRAKQKDFVGNIYVGRVVKVLPGISGWTRQLSCTYQISRLTRRRATR